MHEIITNLHIHTQYSDGLGTHADIARAAMRAGIDAVIVTDHNVLVEGPESVFRDGDKRVVLLVGEEIHDQARSPQKNHLLVIGAGKDLATYAYDPQVLLDSVRNARGLSFIAHPIEKAAPAMNEPDISWVDWQIQGYTGIELWNHMSEFKSKLKSMLHAIYYVFNPYAIATGPFSSAIQKWDELLTNGRRVVAVGGSDAHAFIRFLGPIRRILFPYEFHFRSINNHLFLPSPLTGEIENDRRLILEALAQGKAFIGYDLPASTRGFRFTAQGKDASAWIGEEISAQNGVTLQIRLPRPAECRLIRNGKAIKTWTRRETCTHITTEPGVYRVEVFIQYLGQRRRWIFSNPIYVVK